MAHWSEGDLGATAATYHARYFIVYRFLKAVAIILALFVFVKYRNWISANAIFIVCGGIILIVIELFYQHATYKRFLMSLLQSEYNTCLDEVRNHRDEVENTFNDIRDAVREIAHNTTRT